MRDSEAVEEARRALGRQLAAYRRAAGQSQAELCAELYCSRSTIANVETGRQDFGFGRLGRWAGDCHD